ncbi:fluoride efflux transporter FluC [Bhargavaea ullalensis]|uniref:Fluoride-specific ion channel FluC n=1 Tax=Bhargavaea ullalensis TaxID=1265685 RepID=A0ABV2GAM0_9BACL
MKAWIAVGIGGAAGATGRFLVGLLLQQSGGFPYGTLFVNLTGTFVLCALISASPFKGAWKSGVQTGFLGSFTTFSALGTELAGFLDEQRWATAGLYAAVSLAGGFIAGTAGFRAGERSESA